MYITIDQFLEVALESINKFRVHYSSMKNEDSQAKRKYDDWMEKFLIWEETSNMSYQEKNHG